VVGRNGWAYPVEIKQIAEHSYMIEINGGGFIASCLLYRSGEGTVMVDTGARYDPALFDTLAETGFEVRAAICTHLHLYHTANNSVIAARGGKVFADFEEQTPYFTGAPQSLDNVSFFYGESIRLLGEDFRIIPTPGHTPGHIAVVTPDEICHVGDAVMSPEELAAAKLPYLEFTGDAVRSMKLLRHAECSGFVVAHRGFYTPEQFPAVAEMNIQKELDLYELLKAQVNSPIDADALALQFIKSLGITRRSALTHPAWRRSVKERIWDVVAEGGLRQRGNIILPR